MFPGVTSCIIQNSVSAHTHKLSPINAETFQPLQGLLQDPNPTFATVLPACVHNGTYWEEVTYLPSQRQYVGASQEGWACECHECPDPECPDYNYNAIWKSWSEQAWAWWSAYRNVFQC